MIPFTIIKLYLFFKPAFFNKERLTFLNIKSLFFIVFFLSFFIIFFNVFLFYFIYSIQLFEFNLDTSTKILIDLKKMIIFISLFTKYNLFVFLPFNLFLIITLNFFKDIVKIKVNPRVANSFFFSYLFLMNFFPMDNIAQLLIFYFSQMIQLEILIFLEFLILYKSSRKVI